MTVEPARSREQASGAGGQRGGVAGDEVGAVEPGDVLELLATEFVALAAALVQEGTVFGVLTRIVHAAKAVVPGADMVSITMRTAGGGFETPVRTDPLAVQLDERQYRFDEGPCVQASTDCGVAVAFDADLGAGAVYPRWGPAAAATGVHGVLSVGLYPHGPDACAGALNAYSLHRGGLDARDRDLLVVLAAHASAALAATVASSATSAAELEAAHLREALRTRDVIGQAKGILMERRGISADDAFDALRRASQSLNIKLVQIAQALAENRDRI